MVYNGVLLPGDMSPLSGQHSLDWILSGMYSLIYRGKRDSEHCTISSTNTEQVLKKARQPCAPSVKSTVQVAPRVASLYWGERDIAASLDYPMEEAGDCPFHQHYSDKMKYGGAHQAATSPCQGVPSLSLQKAYPCGGQGSGLSSVKRR